MPTLRQFPQFTLSRLHAAVERVGEAIWHSPEPVGLAKARETREPVPLGQVANASFRPVVVPLNWGRLFHYTWFRLDLPRATAPGRRYLRWMEQGEATLHVDGQPYYGFDVAHRFALLPEGVRTVHVESMCCQSAIWHPAATGLDPQGSRVEGADVVQRNDDAWHAWHDLTVLREVLIAQMEKLPDAAAYLTPRPGVRPPLLKLPVWVRSLIEAIDRAIDQLDMHGVSALRATLKKLYASFPAEWHQIRASLVGHAHIDLVWMWPERTGESKAVHTFATALRLMEQYPEFHFAYTQTASYEAVARLAPGLVKPVRARMRQHRWELLGAAYIESDTVLTCGEALLRSLLVGQEARAPWTDQASRILWLPDVFGYAGCLPRLMQMAGIDWFFTSKVAWRRVTHFPHSSFRWRGSDGTEVLAHVSFEVQQCYNGTATIRELHEAAATHKQAHLHPEALVPTGFGDGGGGPTEEMCERARRFTDLVSVPKSSWGTVQAFFERLAPLSATLPVWSGEMYLEMHRGTFTTQAAMKAAYRAAERGLQVWEAAHCATGRGAIDDRVWKRVIFAQFHDALPGSSFHETYAELVPELQSIAGSSRESAKASLGRRGGKACLFNPLPQVVVERVRDGARSRRVVLPPLSGVELGEEGSQDDLVRVIVRARSLSNDRLKVGFTTAGEIESLVVDGSPVALAETGGQLWVYPDHPHDYPAWEVDHEAFRLGRRIEGGAHVESSGDGEGEGAVAFARTLPDNAGSVRITYHLRAGEPCVRVVCEVDLQKPQVLLRWVCPTRYLGAAARFGAPFGSVLRPQLPGRPGDEAYWESPASRWAMVSEDGERDGFFVVTEAKYGFEAWEGVLAVTLLRSAHQTGEPASFARSAPPSLRETGRKAFPDVGRHTIGLAFGRFDPTAPRRELPASLADILFTKPVAYQGVPVSSGFAGLVGGESLIPAWARPLSGDRWLLRLHETLGRRGGTRIILEPGYVLESVGVRDAVGQPVSPEVAFGPYQILSFVIRRGQPLRRSRG